MSAWRSHFDVNFFSLVTALKAALLSLRESELGGRVIFVSSGAAVKGNPGFGPYNASKAGMNSLCRQVIYFRRMESHGDNTCRTLAEEEPGIVSVALRPGMVDTEVRWQSPMVIFVLKT